MPRTTKDSEKDELNKKKTTTKKSATETKNTAGTKSTTTAKNKKVDEVKPVVTVTKSKAKKEDKEKTTKSTTKKSTTSSTTKKKTTAKASSEDKKTKITTKKAASTKTSTKKKTATVDTKKKSTTTKKKTTASTTRKKATTKKLEETIVAEYYDLPYRYNETVVKILYQTPTILFVYWDISDYDRENYIKHYGENFFNNTKPVLKVYNLTKDYSFEVEINDFANSWYINVNDANCVYKVELSRRKIDFVENLHSDYVYITSSNNIEFPNDHILLEKLPSKIRFKNVKTNQVSLKDISTLHLIGINKIYNVKEFYNKFYKDEIEENVISNPSSSSWR